MKMTMQELEWSRETIHLFVDVLFWFEEYGHRKATKQEEIIFDQRMKTFTDHVESGEDEVGIFTKSLVMMTLGQAQDAWKNNREGLMRMGAIIDLVGSLTTDFEFEFSKN